ncbi:MAG TPA: hypothetical protein PLT93_17830 [Phycisphaerae bacterium]|nr:hypothetical protein [Phycisphaerae bacterium]
MCGVIFVIGLVWHKTWGTTAQGWAAFWYYLVWLAMIMGSIILVWFAVGGIRDMIDMFARLRTMTRDETDDGMVRDS